MSSRHPCRRQAPLKALRRDPVADQLEYGRRADLFDLAVFLDRSALRRLEQVVKTRQLGDRRTRIALQRRPHENQVGVGRQLDIEAANDCKHGRFQQPQRRDGVVASGQRCAHGEHGRDLQGIARGHVVEELRTCAAGRRSRPGGKDRFRYLPKPRPLMPTLRSQRAQHNRGTTKRTPRVAHLPT